jgi:hypothetical protein
MRAALLRLLTAGYGTRLPKPMRQACPQPAEADVRAFGRHSGYDPLRTLARSGGRLDLRQTGCAPWPAGWYDQRWQSVGGKILWLA